MIQNSPSLTKRLSSRRQNFDRWSLAGSPDDHCTSRTSSRSRSGTPKRVWCLLSSPCARHIVAKHMQAMAGASEGDRSDDDAERHTAPTHNEEQEELKRSFLLASTPVIH